MCSSFTVREAISPTVYYHSPKNYFPWQGNLVIGISAAVGITALVVGILAYCQVIQAIPPQGSYAFIYGGGFILVLDFAILTLLAIKHYVAIQPLKEFMEKEKQNQSSISFYRHVFETTLEVDEDEPKCLTCFDIDNITGVMLNQLGAGSEIHLFLDVEQARAFEDYQNDHIGFKSFFWHYPESEDPPFEESDDYSYSGISIRGSSAEDRSYRSSREADGAESSGE